MRVLWQAQKVEPSRRQRTWRLLDRRPEGRRLRAPARVPGGLHGLARGLGLRPSLSLSLSLSLSALPLPSVSGPPKTPTRSPTLEGMPEERSVRGIRGSLDYGVSLAASATSLRFLCSFSSLPSPLLQSFNRFAVAGPLPVLL